MPSSNRLITICVICGNQKRYTEVSNGKVNMNDIHRDVRNLFGTLLPKSYCIQTYNPETKKFINLDQDELDYRYNPFRLYLPVDDQDSLPRMLNDVDLYITEASPVDFNNDMQSNLSSQEVISIDHNYSSRTVMNEYECQQAPPINNRTTNSNDSHRGGLRSAFRNEEQVDIDVLDDILSNDGDFGLPALFETFDEGEQDLASYEILLNDIDLEPAALPDVPLVSEDQPDQNSSVNNYSSDQISSTTEGVTLLQDNFLTSTENLNVRQNSIERSSEARNTHLNPLYFTLDVKPVQKSIYKSDQFNQKRKTTTNGYITNIQGIKTGKPAKSSVLPKIHIPTQYQYQPNVWLDTYVVSEKLQDEKRFWIKHRDKGFLSKLYTRNTPPVNPISFALNEVVLTEEGDLNLKLPMTTMWDKSESLEEEVYQLDEYAAIDLHQAAYEPSWPRLLCVIRQGSVALWETACLSDYIRSTKARKRALSNSNIAIQNNATNCKRARTK